MGKKQIMVLLAVIFLSLYVAGFTISVLAYLVLLIFLISKRKIFWIPLVVIIGFFVIDISLPYSGTVIDANSNEPLEGINIFYSINGPSLLSIAHPVQVDLRRGSVTTDTKGKLAIPLYVGFNIDAYIENKYLRVNSNNLFYQLDKWVAFKGYEDSPHFVTITKTNIIPLERNSRYFDSISNLMRSNTTYGFCNRDTEYITGLQQMYNTKNESDLNSLHIYYGFRDIDVERTVNFNIDGIGYGCFVMRSDKPIFKINHHLLPATGRKFYPEVAKYLYINGTIYDGSETQLTKMGIDWGGSDPGVFFFTTDIIENVSHVYYTYDTYTNCTLYPKDVGLCNYNNAKLTNKTDLCEESGSFKLQCYYYFANLNNDASLCAKSEQLSDECYYKFAFKFGDVNLCHKTNVSKSDCFYKFAIEQRNVNLCAYTDEPNKNECYLILSDRQKAISICENKEKKQKREDCFWNYGILREDVSFCELAGDYAANCYFEIALKSNNSHLCELAGPWETECYKKLIRSDFIVSECPQKERIDCMPAIASENIKYCIRENRDWIQKNCNVSYTD